MKLFKIGLMFIFLVFFVGCNDVSKIVEEDVAYEVKTSNLKDVEILLDRFNRLPVSLLSSVVYDREKEELIFKRGVPDEELVEFMAMTYGKLAIYSDEDPTIYLTNQHIKLASASDNADSIFIQLGLTDEGLEQLHKIIYPLGKVITVKLDEDVIARALVKQDLGKYFEVPFAGDGNLERAEQLAVLIESATLSEPVLVEKIFRK